MWIFCRTRWTAFSGRKISNSWRRRRKPNDRTWYRSFIPRSDGQWWQLVFGYTDWGRQRDVLLLLEERPGILLQGPAPTSYSVHKMSFLVISSRLETLTRSSAVGSSTSHMKKKTVPLIALWGLIPRDISVPITVSFVKRHILCVRFSTLKTDTFFFPNFCNSWGYSKSPSSFMCCS